MNHKNFQAMLAHIDEGFLLDTSQEYPHDSLKGHYGGYEMVVQRMTKRSPMADSTRSLYTLLSVFIGGEVVDQWGLTSNEDENDLIAWWGKHHNHLNDAKGERRKAFKAMYRQGVSTESEY